MAHPIYVLLLLLPVLAVTPSFAQKGFWNIDCGGTENFTTTNGLLFEADGSYARTGLRQQISNISSVSAKALQTLRYFPNGTKKKNCYTIPVPKGTKVLVRARFRYGNYDNKRKPPKFKLLFDSNEWSEVGTTNDTTQLYEIVYETKRKNTSICLGRIDGGGDPFVSAIEVKTLNESMYAGLDYTNHAMYSMATVYFSNNSTVLRHPNDRYDRIWVPEQQSYQILNTASNGTAVNHSTTPDDPPKELFAAAATAGKDGNLVINASYLPKVPVQIYLTMYFTGRQAGMNRSIFHLKVGDDSHLIEPRFKSTLEFYGMFANATNNTKFVLERTKTSGLPPFISGMEVFWITDILTEGTNDKDVNALSKIQQQSEDLRQYTGDPCLPKNYSWDWVLCSNATNTSTSPRITQLLADGRGLQGNIPDFSDLQELEIINLKNNNLTGPIPEFLGNLPNLKMLNLTGNKFSCIPSSLMSKNITLNLDTLGNCTRSAEQGTTPSLGESVTTGLMIPFCTILLIIISIL